MVPTIDPFRHLVARNSDTTACALQVGVISLGAPVRTLAEQRSPDAKPPHGRRSVKKPGFLHENAASKIFFALPAAWHRLR
jgi:hypothetical protein